MKEAENVQNFKLRHFSIFVCYSKYYIEVDFVKIPPIGSFKRYLGKLKKVIKICQNSKILQQKNGGTDNKEEQRQQNRDGLGVQSCHHHACSGVPWGGYSV